MPDFVVLGPPQAKERPRARIMGGYARIYTPKKSAEYEAMVAEAAKRFFNAPIDGPVRLRVVAVFGLPKSWSRKKREAMRGAYHTQKPDGDNILKAIEDGLNHVAWHDDSQVADARIVKRWGDDPHVFVRVGRAE